MAKRNFPGTFKEFRKLICKAGLRGKWIYRKRSARFRSKAGAVVVWRKGGEVGFRGNKGAAYKAASITNNAAAQLFPLSFLRFRVDSLDPNIMYDTVAHWL